MRSLLTVVAAAVTILVEVGSVRAKGLDFYFVDVEGGAATLVVSPSGESLLIDSGNPGSRDAGRILKVARDVAGLKAIDHLVTTHWHVDHYGGIGAIAEKMPIRSFHDRGVPESLPEDKQYFPLLIPTYRKLSAGKRSELNPGDHILLDGDGNGTLPVDFVCLTSAGRVIDRKPNAPANACCGAAVEKPADPSDNAKSLSLLLKFGAFTYLNCGDLTWNVERALVCPSDPIGKVEVFQVTHHGLDVSNNPVLVNTVQPHLAIFSNGPSKGAMPPVMKVLRSLPDLQAIYQIHRNERVDESLNTHPDFIANLSSKCAGEYIHLSVAPDGKSYTVRVSGKDSIRTYKTRQS